MESAWRRFFFLWVLEELTCKVNLFNQVEGLKALHSAVTLPVGPFSDVSVDFVV